MNIRMILKSCLILTILLACFAGYGGIVKVDPAGTGHSTSIQGGINQANPGDTVLVYPSTYYETVDFMGKNITVCSFFLTSGDTSFISQTVIDGNHNHNRLVRFTHGETRQARLAGFTITHAYDDTAGSGYRISGLGIYIENSSPTIEYNHIENSEFGQWYISGGGIAMINSGAMIRNNRIIHNEYAHRGGGIYIEGGIGQIIDGNYIAHHYLVSGYGVAEGGGIYIYGASGTIIRNNLLENNFLDNGFGSDVMITASNNIHLQSNIMRNSKSLYWSGEVEWWGVNNGVMVNNLIYNDMYPNRGLLKISGCTLSVVNTTLLNRDSCSVIIENSSVSFINDVLYPVYNTISGNQVKLTSATAVFSHCLIDGDTIGFRLIDSCLVTAESIINQDPLFSNDPDFPYSISENSPCVNSGQHDTTGLFLPVVDLAGHYRIVDDTIDIGAYENQLLSGIVPSLVAFDLKIYPNPARDVVRIEVREGFREGFIYDSQGKMLLTILNASGGSSKEVDISTLPAGLYSVRLNGNKGVAKGRIMVIKD